MNNRRKISIRRAKKQTCSSFSERTGANLKSLFCCNAATISSHKAGGTQSRLTPVFLFYWDGGKRWEKREMREIWEIWEIWEILELTDKQMVEFFLVERRWYDKGDEGGMMVLHESPQMNRELNG